MQLTVVSSSVGQVISLVVGDEMEMENFLALVQLEASSLANHAADELIIMHAGRTLHAKDILKSTLKSLNIGDNDMLLISVPPTITAAAPAAVPELAAIDFASIRVPTGASARRRPVDNATSSNNSFDLATHYERMRSDSALRIRLRESNPQLSAAIEAGDFARFSAIIQDGLREHREQAVRRLNMLRADPMNADTQRLIEEEIHRQNIEHTLESAYEHMPESFANVHMLYINCKVNGHDVKAFVDSGAQRTIMSSNCAQRCNVMRLADKRFHGTAQGVGGSQRIIGRIHMAQIQIENDFLPMSFDVLDEQPMDVLLGLDMLKRHQCSIDLKMNVLRIGDQTMTKFLHENELPIHARLHHDDDNQQEPNVSGDGADFATKVESLVAMGFAADDASQELRKTNGNVNQAAVNLLLKRNAVGQ